MDSPLVSYYKQARNYRKGRSGSIDLVVIHTAEAPRERGGRWVIDYFATTSRVASCHYGVGAYDVAQGVREADTAYAAPGSNHDGIQIELQAYASDAWKTPAAISQLRLCAALTRDICSRHHLPLVKLSPQDLRAGKQGICGHHDVSEAFKRSTHTDPGRNFPWPLFMGWLQDEEEPLSAKEVEEIRKFTKAAKLEVIKEIRAARDMILESLKK